MIMEMDLNEVYSLYTKRYTRGFYCISASMYMSFSEYIDNELLNIVKRDYFSKINKVKII